MKDLCVFDDDDILLGHVGDLWSGPVPGVHEDSVVGLLAPLTVFLVHLFDPIGGSPGSLVPTNDNSAVSPSGMFDNLSDSVLDVRGPGLSGFRALTKEPVLVPEFENFDCRALSIRILFIPVNAPEVELQLVLDDVLAPGLPGVQS